jgi:1-pyrroline-5-carboxylate dehydrogenase
MSNAIFKIPPPINETVRTYAPETPERAALKAALADMKSQQVEIPMYIDGKEIHTSEKITIRPPHETAHILGTFSKGGTAHVDLAIKAALKAKADWENMPWQERAAIFLKAADLIATKYRATINAATMLGQSKNAYQAEIDAACELADFYRFNVQFMMDIYAQQPNSAPLTWNRTEYRPLEGFVFALTPFNFTAIAGNLPAAPALLGNTVVWKPADTQVYSAQVIMKILMEAGLPDGVINLIYADGPVVGDTVFAHREFAGLHFTGSTKVFNTLWQNIGQNIGKYKSYPRIVGETGGKDFVVVHPSADARAVSVALVRGSFEYQGQKCSAASRAYIPKSLWKTIKEQLIEDIATIKMGTVEDFSNFMNAVIDERSFDKITNYIAQARTSPDASVCIGGKSDKKHGYFVAPTVIEAKDPMYTTMQEEIFGPVLTVYIYDDKKFDQMLEIVDTTSNYALTGAIFSQDRAAIDTMTQKLRHSAGNFYINDKPTGAVVGQQPFGGARGSGTNDKAGSALNLYRWISARSIKETFVPPVDYRYPFLG